MKTSKAAAVQTAAAFLLSDEKRFATASVCSSVMKFCRKVVVLSVGLLPMIAFGAVGDFSNIPKRNVFGLLPPKPEQRTEVIRPALPQVSLQGVSALLDARQALLKIQTKGAAVGAEVCCILSEGQSRDGVKVLRIEMESGTVWLTNQGDEQILTLKRGQ